MTVESFRKALENFLNDMDRISESHDEVTDTDVREALHLTLNHYFVWGRDTSRFPTHFGMFTAEGNAVVAEVVRRFVLEATRLSSHLSVGEDRLRALQDGSVRSSGGRLYDEYFGHREVPLPAEDLPETYFAEGGG